MSPPDTPTVISAAEPRAAASGWVVHPIGMDLICKMPQLDVDCHRCVCFTAYIPLSLAAIRGSLGNLKNRRLAGGNMHGFNSFAYSAKQSGEPVELESREIAIALQLLRQATVYALDVGQDRWQFAVEIEQLRKLGLTDSALRWMLCKGTIAHAEEITNRDDRHRTFRSLGLFTLSDRACFVLSADAAGSVQTLLSHSTSVVGDLLEVQSPSDHCLPNSGSIPVWDSLRHELRLGESLVKRFKHRSPNQEAVLTAFQEEGWPYKVDDPLPQFDECDPKRRLSDTIRGLNHHQLQFLVRFRGDGTGEAVIWELAQCSRRQESQLVGL